MYIPSFDTESAFPRGNFTHGLSKREYFAGLVMQGFAAMPDKGGSFSNMEEAIQQMAEASVKCADALLIELKK